MKGLKPTVLLLLNICLASLVACNKDDEPTTDNSGDLASMKVSDKTIKFSHGYYYNYSNEEGDNTIVWLYTFNALECGEDPSKIPSSGNFSEIVMELYDIKNNKTNIYEIEATLDIPYSEFDKDYYDDYKEYYMVWSSKNKGNTMTVSQSKDFFKIVAANLNAEQELKGDNNTNDVKLDIKVNGNLSEIVYNDGHDFYSSRCIIMEEIKDKSLINKLLLRQRHLKTSN